MAGLTELGRKVLIAIGDLNFEGTGETSEDGCPYCDVSDVAKRIGEKVEAVKGALDKLYKDRLAFGDYSRNTADLQLTTEGWNIWFEERKAEEKPEKAEKEVDAFQIRAKAKRLVEAAILKVQNKIFEEAKEAASQESTLETLTEEWKLLVGQMTCVCEAAKQAAVEAARNW